MNLFKELLGKGALFESNTSIIFFGNDSFDGNLNGFPNLTSHWLQQIHGNKIVRASDQKPQADGQYTYDSNKALFIKTADCMPVFVIGEGKVIALHIGWRGLKKKIMSHTVHRIDNPSSYEVFIGPHIGYHSFQLDEQSTENLLKTHDLSLREALKRQLARISFTQNNHFYIDLSGILKLEILNLGIKKISQVPINTFQSPFHFSHRRNKWRKGQNYSFAININQTKGIK